MTAGFLCKEKLTSIGMYPFGYVGKITAGNEGNVRSEPLPCPISLTKYGLSWGKMLSGVQER